MRPLPCLKKVTKLTQDRFSNLMSYMYSFLIKPKKFEDHMKFNYFTSKKLTTDSSIYLIIQYKMTMFNPNSICSIGNNCSIDYVNTIF